MRKNLSNEAKIHSAITSLRIKCKCGHSVLVPAFNDKVLCDWCGHYVFKDERTEFKYRLKERLNK